MPASSLPPSSTLRQAQPNCDRTSLLPSCASLGYHTPPRFRRRLPPVPAPCLSPPRTLAPAFEGPCSPEELGFGPAATLPPRDPTEAHRISAVGPPFGPEKGPRLPSTPQDLTEVPEILAVASPSGPDMGPAAALPSQDLMGGPPDPCRRPPPLKIRREAHRIPGAALLPSRSDGRPTGSLPLRLPPA
ncbi:hypothetical protein BRADI_3g02875v3 [Brachypodium distachyon]|uniref:Uncharacterized protein n=1 Tax=Brachypodium distachyon TaxID=15368 RepID=A0A2K2CUU3_BRADI|nr:hypothetical protein BRADI_3g02875v3 [Brachypodium distachyon]